MEHVQPGRAWDRTVTIVIVIFSVVHAGAGKLEIRRTDSPIEALLGHNTTIPCHISGYKASSLDTSMVYVRWTRADELVYLFIGGRHTQYRSGSYISEHGIAGGDASLYMPDIRFSDEGEYTCFVTVTPDDAISTVTVRLSAMPSCRLSDSTLVMNPDTERSVTCYVSGFYPESVKIQWLKYSKASSNQSELNSQTCTSVPVQNHDGTHNVTSVLSTRPVSTDMDGDVYSCVVSHRSLTDGLNCNVSLSVHPVPENNTAVIWLVVLAIVALLSMLLTLGLIYRYRFKKAPIEVMDIIGPELIHMQKANLACPIVNFRPKGIDLSLYIIKDNEKSLVSEWSSKKTKNEQDVPLLNPSLLTLMPSIIQAGNGFFSCICSIAITPQFHEHDGATIILQVEHEAVKDPICKELTLRVKAPPVLDPIKTNQESYNIGDHLELTCKIHSFHPQKINVTWCKGKETLLSENNEAERDRIGLFYVTSCVQATVQEEDFGKVFRCKVEHQGVRNEVTWKLQKQVHAS
ncbi:natural cytotoxicity triggering receptor 3 ligand 1-like [Bufo gargarizans]|uniref:natural cytotoxicity triggering receptor 3 ligand 1-like n=1 Tax=Bufo gargarizans TaxID=30331 RepID=UPI001CF138EC|nr:natural cytotoxicity triggering receptor 3 ligand 1-like [Bufo gargarizans]